MGLAKKIARNGSVCNKAERVSNRLFDLTYI